jgi:hypothetical protein
MRITYGCVVLAIGLVGVAFGDTRVNGTVTDENGGAISGAMILLHWDEERLGIDD